ncbi:MAG: UDP-N-acetylmuramate--L-alanine ligase [Deltaproteobacteria bacterium]|nr:MAG: UDP-N-acetylmuramate--L-alanine ligase [Deltaproteobacteria bacterium]
MFRGRIQHIHMVGIGGTGMCGIAEVLLTQGFRVTGSDVRESATLERLRRLGGRIWVGHAAEHVAGADVVVKSTAIPPDNVEIQAAEAALVPVIPRAEMLAELMRMKYGLAVAGSHGKTTTTSMLAACLATAGLDPTIVIGGRLDRIGSTARLGMGEHLVAEADESDGSFMLLAPTVAVVTSIDPEHLDHWGDLDTLLDGFAAFASKVPFYGFAVVCLDHPNVQAILPRIRRRTITYGLGAQAEVRGTDIRPDGVHTRFAVLRHGQPLGELALSMPGRHNVRNALAATAVALELGIDFSTVAEALDGFTGVDRRFSIRAVLAPPAGGEPVTIIDDYGHHPAEIQATLTAAAEAWPHRRVIAVFQPHRYTRVRDLFDDFARSFNQAGQVLVTPIYRAGERPLDGIDHHRIATAMRDRGHRAVVAVDGLDAAVDWLRDEVRPGDVVLTLGAGDVNRVCTDLDAALRAQGFRAAEHG